LNIGVPGNERVNQKVGGHRHVFEPNVLVVNPGGPAGSKCPFDAPSGHPATGGSGFAEGCERRVDGSTGLNPATAAFGVKQPVVKTRASKPDAACSRRNPIRLRRSRHQADTGNDNSITGVLVARNPIEETFDAENEEGANLVIESDLTTANEGAAGIGAEVQTGQPISDVKVLPASSDVATDIEAGPAEQRWRNWGRRQRTRLGIQISCCCCGASATSATVPNSRRFISECLLGSYALTATYLSDPLLGIHPRASTWIKSPNVIGRTQPLESLTRNIDNRSPFSVLEVRMRSERGRV
jgi:hypothetical protein